MKNLQIFMTDVASENVLRLQSEYEADGYGLRFGLTGGGCSGYKYVLELEDEPETVDMVFTFNGIRVFVNPDHMLKLKGSTIDWKESLMEAGFEIINPQAKRACGCGESFDIKE
tara:strand:+ start:615 stop:956 length:342 start_codon:yes stop_codon:yes gene_type:complete